MSDTITRRQLIQIISEMRGAAPRKHTKDFKAIARGIARHDKEVRQLFKISGLSFRNPGHWYPLIGLLAELVGPELGVKVSGGRPTYWTPQRRRSLLSQYENYRAKYPKRNSDAIFKAIIKDHPRLYPSGSSPQSLARRRRETLRMGAFAS
jgi:hypothetical protein